MGMSVEDAVKCMKEHLEAAIAERLYQVKDSEFAGVLGMDGDFSQNSTATTGASLAAFNFLATKSKLPNLKVV